MFRFRVRELQLGRGVLRRAESGEFRGYSIGLRIQDQMLDRSGYVWRVQRAELVEVSLVELGRNRYVKGGCAESRQTGKPISR